MNTRKVAHVLAMISVAIERIATVSLAVLLYRLHNRMSQTQSLGFMNEWVHKEKKWTFAAIVLLVLAFIGTLVSEILLWIQEDDDV